MNPITTYDLILKARADMNEKNAYCQKHFDCDYSECTPKQKAQCDKHCGELKKRELEDDERVCFTCGEITADWDLINEGYECEECSARNRTEYEKRKWGGSLPDHSGDGKITQKDRLMAIGAIDKPNSSSTKKSDDKAYKNMNCMDCSDGMDSDGNACENCYKPKDTKKSLNLAFHTGWTIAKAQPCSVRGCGAMPGDGPENCNAGENPALCTRRKAASRQDNKQMRRQKGKVKHLDMATDDYKSY